MNPRTIRRAIERKAQKQARKADQQQQIQSCEQQHQHEIIAAAPSKRRLLANIQNARLSTGPRTPEGKAASSHNALKSGLTGKTVLLPNEDAALYQQHVDGFCGELKPVGDREIALVQSIADSKWRLARIPSLEFGIYALGRIEFAEEFAHHSSAEAVALIEAKTFIAYQRQLNNLSIQESRLRRQCEKDTAELVRLQQLRAEAARQSAATPRKPAAQPTPPINIGFEFESALQVSCGAESEPVECEALALPQVA